MLRPTSLLAQVPTHSHIYVDQCINIRCSGCWRIFTADPLEGAAGRDSVQTKPKPSQPAPVTERAFRLLDPWRERDACGVGFVARADGERTPDILAMALTAVARLAHRGAASNDKSGDGAGVLTQIPHRLLGVGPVERVALGMFFLPQAAAARDVAIDLIETVLVSLGMSVLGWRVVPVNGDVLGPLAAASQPTILHVFVCSLSCRTVVYKALLVGTELPGFYADLESPLFETGIAVFHQRYSTNTLPS